MGEILAAIVSAVLGAYVSFILQDRSSKAKLKQVKNSYRLPPPIPIEDKRNTLLLIGLGGSGKTSVIKTLLRNSQANPEEKTEKFEIYSGQIVSETVNYENTQQTLDINKPTRYWFYVADYLGQNIGQLVRSFVVQQKKQYSPLAYGYVTSLVLIVDLFPDKNSPQDPDPEPQPLPDENRINKHNNEWNDTSLDAIFGLLTNELKYVCLFINKVDLMSDRQTGSDQRYISYFKDLARRIQKRCGDAKFEIILGSAKRGTGIAELSFKLMEFSID